jgi:transcriptional regulator
MYLPKAFENNDPAQLEAVIQENPLATLISYLPSGLEANHLPLMLQQEKGKTILKGHIAKANDLWMKLDSNNEVLVVFQGPDSYISPSFYPSKQVDGKVVPTWNYVAVHVKGRMAFHHDEAWKIGFLNQLTAQHEASFEQPWNVSDAPKDYTDKMLGAIVGIEIEVLDMKGKWKVSQNQSRQNQMGVIEGLSQVDDEANQKNNVTMAALVKDRLKNG